jgi:hypothetical protein
MHAEPGAPGPARRGLIGLGAPVPLLFRRAGPAAHERGAAGPSRTCRCRYPRVVRGTGRVNPGQVSFNAPVPGGVMISEKIQIGIEAEAVLKKD